MKQAMRQSVVIVEDDTNIALAQKMILEEHYDVHVAHDGEAGLSLIRKVRPAVAVLDVMMPKMDGFEVCRKVKGDKQLQTKVVMVTAKNQDRDERQGLELGADDYIMKPFEDVELLHVVRQVLRGA